MPINGVHISMVLSDQKLYQRKSSRSDRDVQSTKSVLVKSWTSQDAFVSIEQNSYDLLSVVFNSDVERVKSI